MEGSGQHPDRPAPDEHASGGASGERVYDSFVVRLWREVGNPRLLRVAVEHAQSGGGASAHGVGFEWIGARIADLLREPQAPPD